MKKILLFICCISLFVGSAQNGFTTYTTNIPITGAVKKQTAFLVDANNDKWIGYKTLGASSNAGLMKYENATGNWKLYNYTSSPALTSNWVTALVKDNSGNLWIGTDSALYKFNGTVFIKYTTVNGLPANRINCLETSGSMIFIGTVAGMSVYDGTSFTNFNVSNGKLPYDNITAIKAETSNLIWINGAANTLVQFNIVSTLSNTSFSVKPFLGYGGSLTAIHVDALNNKWVASSFGVWLYDGVSFSSLESKYDIVGAVWGIKDFATGPHNGVVFKFEHNGLQTSFQSYLGLIEINPLGKQYYYVKSATSFSLNAMGDFIESHGNKLYITAYTSTGSPNSNAFHEFDVNSYSVPYGLVTGDNYKFLDANKVKAGIANRSDMHWDIGGGGDARYGVPYSGSFATSPNSNFATALWIGGYDNANQLHLGAQTYRQSGVDFWPGPLDTINGTIDTLTSAKYDKIWKVSYNDINTFINAYNSGSVIATEDMMTWPAHGNGNNSRNLAPFVDHNGNGIYNPYEGDYPKIRGDQALYFIYNDNLSAHQNTGALPMGIEVQAMAYAYGCPGNLSGKPELDYTTFYDYKIINRSSNNYHDVYIGLWSDVDLGYYGDDFIGCNVADNYGYAYNGDTKDETQGSTIGYGSYMPAQGFALMKGPKATTSDGLDNDNDGVIDEFGEECLMNKFNYFNNSLAGVPQGMLDPGYPQEYYNYMTGYWKDTTQFTCGGNGYGGTIPASWVYSGDPNTFWANTDPNNTCGYWTDLGPGGDRRLIMSSGPFTLNAGQMQEVEYAFVFSRDTAYPGYNKIAVAKLKNDVQKVRAYYNQTNKPDCLIPLGIKEILKSDNFKIYPNPSSNIVYVKALVDGIAKVNYTLIDVLGKEVMRDEKLNPDFSINISSLKTGVYFLRLEVNNSFIVKKIVRE